MSAAGRAGGQRRSADGVFVVGMDASGADLVRDVLAHMGLRSLGTPGDPGYARLAALNDRLLDALGGSRLDPPDISPPELVRHLGGFADEGAALAAEFLPGVRSRPGGEAPWVWADPSLSLLTPFWARCAGVSPALVFVHRDPGEVAAVVAPEGRAHEVYDALARWDRYNRAAVVLCSQWPAAVIGHEELVAKPEAAVHALAELLDGCGLAVPTDLRKVVELAEAASAGPATAPAAGGAPAEVADPRHRVLARVLDQLDGVHVEGDDGGAANLPALLDALSGFYDADYYGTSYDKSGVPYRRGEKLWADVFAAMATAIVDNVAPRTVLDAGCATGMLVEALRLRGVDARGIDISEWAIGQVPPALRPFCAVGSITEELEGHYDLITCFEVLEHLPPALAEAAVANLCRHADAVLFSSTPDDFDEPTHLNVEPGGYWATLFLHQGFVRDMDVDASFVAPHAVLFRRRSLDTEELVAEYERGWWQATSELRARRDEVLAEHERLVAQYRALVPVAAEARRLHDAVADAERRRAAETRAAYDMVRHYELSERRLSTLVELHQAEVDAIRATKTFRYTTLLRRVYGRLRRMGRPAAVAGTEAAAPAPVVWAGGSYELWVEQFDTLDDGARAAVTERVASLEHPPSISVVMPVYDPPAELLRAAIESVRGQLYGNWELCIADDASPAPHVPEILAEYARADDRIKVTRRTENGHIAAASNSALAMATGDWVACLDHDDVLAEHALALMALAAAAHPDAGVVYSDEDKVDDAGRRRDPFFKPEFDPLLLLGQNFVSHLSMFRRDLVEEVGGYRPGYEGSQDWDLTLRVTERLTPAQVVHVPHVLYHWRAHAASTASLVSAKPYAVDAGRRAVVDHLARTGRQGRVVRIGRSGHNRVTWDLPEPAPTVSIVIPTRDGSLLARCIDSVLSLTTYPSFEMVVVDNSSRTLPTLDYLRRHDDRVTVVRDERPFNYAALNNNAVARTSGEVLCLLNDDTEVLSPDWLTELVGQLLQPGVGAVGAKLYYDDGRIQHAGVVTGLYGVAGHAHRLFDRLSPGYFGHLQLAHAMSAVTAACAVVRRQAWDAVGGLDEVNLPVAFNDVDFCLRLREAGWTVVWTPYAELFHHESVTRGPDDVGPRAPEFLREVDYMLRRWGPAVLRHDPSYNPNLSLEAEDFSLAWPPRVSYR